MKQVHGKEVVIAENTDQADLVGKKLKADGAITQKKNLALTIQTADCVPILLYDPIRQAIGAVHAGWRSAAQGIIAETLSKMERHFNSNPADCHALIGPSIGPCCYEVGEDVIRHFPASVWNRVESEHYRLDLCKTAHTQLSQSGIKEKKILQVGLCTACHRDLFFSYRTEGPNTGRMMALVMMQQKNKLKY
jgi:YfiH family protein